MASSIVASGTSDASRACDGARAPSGPLAAPRGRRGPWGRDQTERAAPVNRELRRPVRRRPVREAFRFAWQAVCLPPVLRAAGAACGGAQEDPAEAGPAAVAAALP